MCSGWEEPRVPGIRSAAGRHQPRQRSARGRRKFRGDQLITINVPVVYMVWEVMILMRATSIPTFLGQNGTRFACCHFRAQKSLDFQGTPSSGPSNGFARIKIIKSKRHIKKRYIGNFMYISVIGNLKYFGSLLKFSAKKCSFALHLVEIDPDQKK